MSKTRNKLFKNCWISISKMFVGQNAGSSNVGWANAGWSNAGWLNAGWMIIHCRFIFLPRFIFFGKAGLFLLEMPDEWILKAGLFF